MQTLSNRANRYEQDKQNQIELGKERKLTRSIGRVGSSLGKQAQFGEKLSFTKRETINKGRVAGQRISDWELGIKQSERYVAKSEETIWCKHIETSRIIRDSRLNWLSIERKKELALALDRDFTLLKCGKIERSSKTGLLITSFESHKIIKNLVTEQLNARYGHNQKREIIKLSAQVENDLHIKAAIKADHDEYLQEKMAKAKAKSAQLLSKKGRKKKHFAYSLNGKKLVGKGIVEINKTQVAFNPGVSFSWKGLCWTVIRSDFDRVLIDNGTEKELVLRRELTDARY